MAETCKACGGTFKDKKELEEHAKKHHGKK